MRFGAACRCGLRWLAPLALLALLAACTGEGAPTVETLAVEQAQVRQTISAPGRLEAAERQAVTATVPGVVARVRAEDGERVEAGDVVVRLASDEVELALEQAEAAEAALGSSGSGVYVEPPGDAAIAAAGDAVAKLDADVEPDLAAARRKAARAAPDERRAAEETLALLEEAYRDVRTALLAAGHAAAAQQNAVAASFSSALDQALTQASAGQAAQAAGAADSAA
ncbi:MAG TPA: biotin/lipoyl-binding protein, partial [Euzebyales bacterium]|nr:biotin/lipoyl-binding protein [Euzebyales bacterium]